MTEKWKIIVPEDFKVSDNEYLINGKSYCRVTETLGVIAKHRLMNWMKRVGEKEANKVLETRQNIGITTHKLIEWTLKDEVYNLGTYENEIQESMCKFYEFRTLASLKPDALEQKLWSNKFGYAGTADYIGTYKTIEKFLVRTQTPKFTKGGYIILDWKTAKDFYPTYRLQLAAYLVAFEELTKLQIDGGAIVLIRNGKLKIKEWTREELLQEFEVYKALLIVYRWWKPEK